MSFEERLLQLKVKAIRSKAGLVDLESSDGSNTRAWHNPQQHQTQPNQYYPRSNNNNYFPSIQQNNANPYNQQYLPQQQPSQQFYMPPKQQTYHQQYLPQHQSSHQFYTPPQQQMYNTAPYQPMQPMFLPSNRSSQQAAQRRRQRRNDRVRRQQQQQQEDQRNMMMMMTQMTANQGGVGMNGGTGQPTREDALLSRLDRVLDQNSKLIEGVNRGTVNRNSYGRRRSNDEQDDYGSDEEDSLSNRNNDPPRRADRYSNGQRTHNDNSNNTISSNNKRFKAPQSQPQQPQQPQQQSQQVVETIDGQKIRYNDQSTLPQQIEGSSPALQNAKKWFVERVSTSSTLLDGTMSATNMLDLESDDEEEDVTDGTEFKINDDSKLKDEDIERNRREMRLKIKKQLGILDLKRPRWRYKDDEDKPPNEDLMKGTQLFRSIVKMVQFPIRLQHLVKVSVQQSVSKDQADVAEFMNLYFDLSKNWLSSLVKIPVLSVVKNRTLNLDVSQKSGIAGGGGALQMFKGFFGAKDMKSIKKEKLMQCKVRVKGMIDVLLSACRTSKVSTGGGSKGIPHKLCEFFAKYFVHDGVAFPNSYLWKTEERELEFNSIGMTRRMVFSEDLDTSASEKKDDEDEAQFDSNVLLNTDRPRLLIVNFLIARVLIGQVLLNTESCQGLGGSSNNSSSNSNSSNKSQFNYKSKRNLQYIASMFYLILQKLYEELPEAYGKPIDKKKITVDDDDEDQDLKEAKLQLSKLKMHTMSSLRHADDAKKKQKKKKKEGDKEEEDEDGEDEGKGKGKKGKKGTKGKRKGETRDSLKKKKKAAAEAKKKKAVALANEKKTKKAAATLAKKKAAEKKKKAAKAALAKKRGTELRRNPDIFTVVFENGPLGLDLEAYRNGKGASIVGIKENTQSAKKRKLYEGQHIVKIGRRKVDTIPFSVILGMLTKLKRPLKMTLREHPSSSKWVDEHTVRFPSGPLGLDLAPGSGQVGTYVKGSKSGEVRPGEYISTVGNKKIDVGDKGMKETIEIIQSCKRPVEITFIHVRNSLPKTQGEETGLGREKSGIANIADGTSRSDSMDGSGHRIKKKDQLAAKFKWSSIGDLTSLLLPIDVFNNACENTEQIDSLDEWIDQMADRLDQWATAVTGEVMKAAAAMQKM